MKVRERGNRKENCKITKMLLDMVTFSWKIISNKIKTTQRSECGQSNLKRKHNAPYDIVSKSKKKEF